MNKPLQEIHAIIERLLFQVGDEQISEPNQVLLVVVNGDESTQYLIQSGTITASVFANVVFIGDDEEASAD